MPVVMYFPPVSGERHKESTNRAYSKGYAELHPHHPGWIALRVLPAGSGEPSEAIMLNGLLVDVGTHYRQGSCCSANKSIDLFTIDSPAQRFAAQTPIATDA
mmetsp:Transcript_78014/g.135229  ORF Transcript_78014/g.135229 Transcript_78014/m.135229 type:complete len:102 (-) Transcript_78014:25-330(-)